MHTLKVTLRISSAMHIRTTHIYAFLSTHILILFYYVCFLQMIKFHNTHRAQKIQIYKVSFSWGIKVAMYKNKIKLKQNKIKIVYHSLKTQFCAFILFIYSIKKVLTCNKFYPTTILENECMKICHEFKFPWKMQKIYYICMSIVYVYNQLVLALWKKIFLMYWYLSWRLWEEGINILFRNINFLNH